MSRRAASDGSSAPFIERTISRIAENLESANRADDVGASSGLLQRLDPRIKVISAAVLIVAVIASHSLIAILATLLFSVGLAVLSRIQFRFLLRFVWLSVFTFTGFLSIPALFFTPGTPIYRLPFLDWPITDHGVRAMEYLVLRSGTTVTIAILLVLSTPWPRLLRSMKILGLPTVVLTLTGMTYRYIMLLLQLALEMFQSRRSRIIAPLAAGDRRKIVTATAGVLLSKSSDLSQEVYQAMQARGHRGELFLLDDLHLNPRDWLAFFLIVPLAVLVIWHW